MQLQRVYSHVQKELPYRNSQVVEYNDALTAATNSNTCVCLFGSTSQSCNGVKYATKYLIKDLRLLQASLTALNHGFQFVEKYQSVASDSGTNKRTTQHWLAHIRNTALLQKEICDTQALAALIGPLDTLITSDSFVYFGPYDHIKQICHQYNIFQHPSQHLSHQIQHSTSNSSRVYEIGKDSNGQPIKQPVEHWKHWLFRGEQLQMLSRCEYYIIVQIKKNTKTPTKKTKRSPGRLPSVKFPFHPLHPLAKTHHQCINTKLPTLIPAGVPPPYPGLDPHSDDPHTQAQWQKKSMNLLYIIYLYSVQNDAIMESCLVTVMTMHRFSVGCDLSILVLCWLTTYDFNPYKI